MKYPKRNTKLWIYLYQNGFLESNDETIIQQAILGYYKKYDRELKMKIRKVEKRNFSISFPTSQINHIRKRAKEYNVSVVDYTKLIVTSDILNTSPLQQTLIYKEILQLLSYYKNAIDSIEAKEPSKWFGNNDYDELRKILESIKDKIEIK